MKCSVQDLEQKVLSCKHSICSHIQLYRTRLQNLTETMIQSATDNLTQHVNNIVSNALQVTQPVGYVGTLPAIRINESTAEWTTRDCYV
jgi:hypothetical protein